MGSASNTGGAWDNCKKMVEAKKLYFPGSDVPIQKKMTVTYIEDGQEVQKTTSTPEHALPLSETPSVTHLRTPPALPLTSLLSSRPLSPSFSAPSLPPTVESSSRNENFTTKLSTVK